MATQIRTPREKSWESAMVDATPEDCYRLWRDVAKLPRFLSFVASVEQTGERWSHWVGRQGDEKTVGWDADLVEDEPMRALTWQPLAHGPEAVAVAVRFDPTSGGRGTLVRLNLKHRSRFDRKATARELRRFKEWVATGGV